MAAPITAVPKAVFLEDAHSTGAVSESAAESTSSKLNHLLDAFAETGWMDVLTAALEERRSLLAILVNELNRPSTVDVVKSFLSLGQVMSSFDASALAAVGKGVADGVNKVHEGQTIEVRGIWDVLKASRDPDISRAFSTILTILKAMGEQLR